MPPPYVAIVGASQAGETEMANAEAVGRLLAGAGAVMVCGGRGGVMAAGCRGVAEAGGTAVGILTGLGELRNGIIVRAADAVIAIGGAYGTLSEIAFALQAGVPVLGLESWDIDGVERVSSPEDAVTRALVLAQEQGRAET